MHGSTPSNSRPGPMDVPQDSNAPARQDDQLCAQIARRLVDSGLDWSNVRMTAKNGAVKLTGQVLRYDDIDRIGQVAATVPGVAVVDNRISAPQIAAGSPAKSDALPAGATHGIADAAIKGAGGVAPH